MRAQDEDDVGDTAYNDIFNVCRALAKEHFPKSSQDHDDFADKTLYPEAVLRIHMKILGVTEKKADELLDQIV